MSEQTSPPKNAEERIDDEILEQVDQMFSTLRPDSRT